jgi:hypothetical protein
MKVFIQSAYKNTELAIALFALYQLTVGVTFGLSTSGIASNQLPMSVNASPKAP